MKLSVKTAILFPASNYQEHYLIAMPFFDSLHYLLYDLFTAN